MTIKKRKRLLAQRVCASRRILAQRFGNVITLSSLRFFLCLPFVPLIGYCHKGLKTETCVPTAHRLFQTTYIFVSEKHCASKKHGAFKRILEQRFVDRIPLSFLCSPFVFPLSPQYKIGTKVTKNYTKLHQIWNMWLLLRLLIKPTFFLTGAKSKTVSPTTLFHHC